MSDRAIQKNLTIKPTGEKLPWLRARESVRGRGGLPSNVLLDEVLVGSHVWQSLNVRYNFAWTREVLVYPAKGARFTKGQDIVDASKDYNGREWILPFSCIPEEAFRREAVGLFVDPQDVEVKGKRVAIIAEPEKVVILSPFIQANDYDGLVDGATRVPLEIDAKPAGPALAGQVRTLRRLEGAGVRPLARILNGVYNEVIYANSRKDAMLKAAYVEDALPLREDKAGTPRKATGSEERAMRLLVSQAPLNGIMVHGVTLTEFRILLGDAAANLAKPGGDPSAADLDAVRKLIRALEINE